MILITVSGCATKSYPIALPLSSAEAERMTCNDLELEIIRAEQIENKINETGSFDGKTALGFLGDFGIGNGIAKSDARKAMSERKSTIRDAQISKGCIGSNTNT